jgi:sodium transport system permease protein
VRAILTVFLKEFRENLRERRTLFTALILGPLLGPVLFAGLLGLQIHRSAEAGDRPLALAVAHGERAPNLLQFLKEAGVTVTAVTYDAGAARYRRIARSAC